MRLNKSWIYTSLTFLAVESASSQQLKPDIRAQIDNFLSRAASFDQFNGVALVAQDGKILYEKAFGLANREWNVPNTVESRFEIA